MAMTVRIKPKSLQALRDLAEAERISLTALLEKAILAYYSESKK